MSIIASEISDILGVETQEFALNGVDIQEYGVGDFNLDLLTPNAFGESVMAANNGVAETTFNDGMDAILVAVADEATNQDAAAEDFIKKIEERQNITIIQDIVIKPPKAAERRSYPNYATPKRTRPSSKLEKLLTTNTGCSKQAFYAKKAQQKSGKSTPDIVEAAAAEPAPERPPVPLTPVVIVKNGPVDGNNRPLSPVIGGKCRRRGVKRLSGAATPSGRPDWLEDFSLSQQEVISPVIGGVYKCREKLMNRIKDRESEKRRLNEQMNELNKQLNELKIKMSKVEEKIETIYLSKRNLDRDSECDVKRLEILDDKFRFRN